MKGDGVGKGREKGTGTAHRYTHLSQEIHTVKPHLAFVTSGNEGKSFSAPKRGGAAQSWSGCSTASVRRACLGCKDTQAQR